MNKHILYALGICLFLFSYACKPKERARRSDLEGKKSEYLLQQMEQNTFTFNTFSAKVGIELEQEKKKTSFRGNLRIQKDSAIWLSITPALGIEVARVLITRDTVKVLNRLNKEFFIGDYSYINQRFNIDLEFELLQSLLLGNTIAFEPDEKLKLSIDKEKYYLGNLKKRKAKKADDKPKKIEKEKEEVISLWINQNNFKVEDFLYSDLSADRFIIGSYREHFLVENQLLPKELKFEFRVKEPKLVSLEYSKVSLNQAIKFSFNISSKYEQVFY
jgi:hypothetical protein